MTYAIHAGHAKMVTQKWSRNTGRIKTGINQLSLQGKSTWNHISTTH
jgi:hypothetical protein